MPDAGTSPDRLPREWLAAVLDHAISLIVILDPDGCILEINRPALAFRGRERQDVIGRRLWELAADAAGARDMRDRIAQAARGKHVRYHLRTRSGDRTVDFDISIKPVLDESGKVRCLVLEARDITESVAAQHLLQQAKQKFAGIVNLSPDAIISVDDDFRITDFNPGAEQIFGYRADEIIGQPLDILIPEPFREAHRRHMRAFAASGVASRRMGERQQISGLRKGGQCFPADASISQQSVEGRKIFTVVLRDITNQRRTESMQRFLAHAGSLLASSLDILSTYEGVAKLAVQEIADACVFFLRDARGASYRAVMATRDPAKLAIIERQKNVSLQPDSPHPVARVLRTRQSLLIRDITTDLNEADVRSEDLEVVKELNVRSVVVVPVVARDRLAGALAVYRTPRSLPFVPEDVTDLEELAVTCGLAADNARLYRESVEAVRARDDILAVVSHDLGNPLSAIRIGVSLLLRMTPEKEKGGAWEHLAGIKHSVEQMERLIRDLLEVKRVEASQLMLALEPCSPRDLIESATEMLAPLARGKSISVRCHVESSVPPVLADRERVIQVLSNLVGNAVKFTPEGGHVKIVAEADTGHVRFSVIDDGPGIAPEDVEHIFDRFWQARRSRQAGKGLGLGLAIVKAIVQAHGGSVWAESVAGAGATVRFTLPIAADKRP